MSICTRNHRSPPSQTSGVPSSAIGNLKSNRCAVDRDKGALLSSLPYGLGTPFADTNSKNEPSRPVFLTGRRFRSWSSTLPTQVEAETAFYAKNRVGPLRILGSILGASSRKWRRPRDHGSPNDQLTRRYRAGAGSRLISHAKVSVDFRLPDFCLAHR